MDDPEVSDGELGEEGKCSNDGVHPIVSQWKEQNSDTAQSLSLVSVCGLAEQLWNPVAI